MITVPKVISDVTKPVGACALHIVRDRDIYEIRKNTFKKTLFVGITTNYTQKNMGRGFFLIVFS